MMRLWLLSVELIPSPLSGLCIGVKPGGDLVIRLGSSRSSAKTVFYAEFEFLGQVATLEVARCVTFEG